VTGAELLLDCEGTEMSKDDPVALGPSSKSIRLRSTLLRLIAHAIAWGLCLGLFVFGVSRIEAIFDDFNMPLPRCTAFVISVAHRIIRYQGLITAGLIVIISSSEWFMPFAVSGQEKSDSFRRLSRLLLATPLVLIVLTLIALSPPLFTLMTPLNLSG
jgi:hypothetical protein